MSALAAKGSDPGERFLQALADPGRPAIPSRTALVIAHPDDETIGCGAQLRRFSDIVIIHVTDGAPRNGADAAALGFTSPSDYGETRRRELEAAMALAGLSPQRLVALGWSDQEASLHLAEIATDLAARLPGTDMVLTHAYEGGHPDHDATAFAVHAACALIARRGNPPVIIEMPLYRAGAEGRVAQRFWPVAAAPEIELALLEQERRLKQAMLAAYATQRAVLSWFTADVERFRAAPRYDFAQLPNGGDLFYERWDWGMSGARWLELCRAARAELELGAAEWA